MRCGPVAGPAEFDPCTPSCVSRSADDVLLEPDEANEDDAEDAVIERPVIGEGRPAFGVPRAPLETLLGFNSRPFTLVCPRRARLALVPGRSLGSGAFAEVFEGGPRGAESQSSAACASTARRRRLHAMMRYANLLGRAT